MNNLKIAVCDDDKTTQQNIISLLEQIDDSMECEVFSSGEELLESYDVGKYDLLFIDIFMGGMTGVEALTKIRTVDKDLPVAFTTSSTEFALEGFRLGAIGYIEKPVDKSNLRKMVETAKMHQLTKPKITVKIDKIDTDVFLSDIIYIEQQAHNIFFYLKNGTQLKSHNKLNNIERDLIPANFFRCHQSYIVNLDFVKDINHELMMFEMQNSDNVHIRRSSFSSAKRAFEQNLFCKVRLIHDT